jgi:hypothetical protein
MTKAVSEILERVKALTPKQRDELFEAIEASFLHDHRMLSAGYKAELMKRAEFMDKHPEKLIPMDGVFRQVKDELGLTGE